MPAGIGSKKFVGASISDQAKKNQMAGLIMLSNVEDFTVLALEVNNAFTVSCFKRMPIDELSVLAVF